MIHLSEIRIIILDTTAVYVGTYLLNKLAENKIPLIICDEKHNPSGEFISLYGAHNASKRVITQTLWTQTAKDDIWAKIIEDKIVKQSYVLETLGFEQGNHLQHYAKDIQPGDVTNREGHAAKVYFNSLFGKSFNREQDSEINAALNYGYAILLSTFNKEIVARGFITQLGIHHRNEYNKYNLGCDLMEPFRPIVDLYVAERPNLLFDEETRLELVKLLEKEVYYREGNYKVSSVITLYTKNIFNILDSGNASTEYKNFSWL